MKKEENIDCNSSVEERFLNGFRSLLAIASPPGFERQAAQWIQAELREMGYSAELDPSGNLLLRLEGQKPDLPQVMLAAHMDEIAVVVRTIQKDGTLLVTPSGGMLPHKVGERPFTFLGDHRSIPGVISTGSGHAAINEASGGRTWHDVTVITGLSCEELKEAGVRPGTPGVPVVEGRGPHLFGSPGKELLSAWTLDDRAGVLVLLEWLRSLQGEKPLHPVCVAWTVHEEGGCLGAAALASRERPGIFIAIDGAPWKANDGYDVDERPVAWSKDMLANYDQGLLAHLRKAAQECSVELQHAVIEDGYSDASSVYKIGASPRVALLGHSRFNSHGFEVARFAVFPTVVRVLKALMDRNLDKPAV